MALSQALLVAVQFEIGELLLQLVILKVYIDSCQKIEKEFGTIILDEMHHVVLPYFR